MVAVAYAPTLNQPAPPPPSRETPLPPLYPPAIGANPIPHRLSPDWDDPIAHHLEPRPIGPKPPTPHTEAAALDDLLTHGGHWESLWAEDLQAAYAVVPSTDRPPSAPVSGSPSNSVLGLCWGLLCGVWRQVQASGEG